MNRLEHIGRGRPLQPDQISQHATLAFGLESDRHTWELFDAQGESVRLEHTPRLVFPTRHGLLPSVRAFIDFLAERMPRLI